MSTAGDMFREDMYLTVDRWEMRLTTPGLSERVANAAVDRQIDGTSQRVWVCRKCSAMVIDAAAHLSWHGSVDSAVMR